MAYPDQWTIKGVPEGLKEAVRAVIKPRGLKVGRFVVNAIEFAVEHPEVVSGDLNIGSVDYALKILRDNGIKEIDLS